jgi:AcrR family transcriptional regulator
MCLPGARPQSALKSLIFKELAPMKSSEDSVRARPSADQKERVGRIALDLFMERGFDATPMSLIAKRAGLTKPGIYHYFESKEALLYFVHIRDIKKTLLPMLEKVRHESDAEKRLQLFVTEYVLALARQPVLKVLISETKSLSAAHQKEIREAWRRGLHLLRDTIAELQKLGRCPDNLDATFAAFGVIGMCSWVTNWFDPKRPEGGPAVASTMVRLILHGILSTERR